MYKDFRKYAKNNVRVSYMDDYFSTQNVTPSILEEGELKGTLISVFDRLMKDRIIFVNTEVNKYMAEIIKAQIMYLSTINEEPINININSPGGSVDEGLVILDAYELSTAPIHTTGHGMCASMGSILLGAGKKGERALTKHSHVMLHQVSYGASGQILDVDIQVEQARLKNDLLFSYLGEYCNKGHEQIKKDAMRDFWMNSVKSLEYGIIDKIIWNKDKIITKDNLKDIKDSVIYKQSKI